MLINASVSNQIKMSKLLNELSEVKRSYSLKKNNEKCFVKNVVERYIAENEDNWLALIKRKSVIKDL